MTDFILNTLAIVFFILISIVNVFHKLLWNVGFGIVNVVRWIGKNLPMVICAACMGLIAYITFFARPVEAEEEIPEPVVLAIIL